MSDPFLLAAKVFLWIGTVLGILGIAGGVILVLGWWHDRRQARQPLFNRKPIEPPVVVKPMPHPTVARFERFQRHRLRP